MIKLTERSAGMFFVVKGGENNGKIVLLRRADNGKQTFPGIYQPPVHGIIKEHENVPAALKREMKEELGERFANTVSIFDSSPLHEAGYEYKNIKREVIKVDACYRVMEITEEQVKLIKLSEEHDDMILVGAGHIRYIVTTKQMKGTRFNPDTNIVMFPDQLNALKKVFSIRE